MDQTLPLLSCRHSSTVTAVPAKPLKLAFCLYKYFPHGGMQRAFIRIARICLDAGAEVTAFVIHWQGEVPAGLSVEKFEATEIFNHTRYERYQNWLGKRLKRQHFDCVVGFNKMPGLDVYYAADTCYLEKALTARSGLYRSTPRFRHFAACERVVFEPAAKTRILMSSPSQMEIFRRHYATPLERFHRLPPGIARDRMAGEDAPERRRRGRSSLGVPDDAFLVLLIGSGFITKGLDRALDAVGALPKELRNKTHLVAVGTDDSGRFRSHATRLGIDARFQVLSGRDDIPDLLQAGELLIHPAYFENTGNVLLEAIVAGLPVLTTDVCGFAHYVTDAGAGCIVTSPYRQMELDQALVRMLTSPERERWRKNGITFGRTADLYSLPQRAAEVILETAGKRT